MRGLWTLASVIAAAALLALLWGGEADTIFGMDGDMVVRAMMLGAIGVAIGAGILGSGIRFGEMTRTIAIWLGILVALVGGYQYRYELQDIASRLTAGLVPGSPISVTDAQGRRTVIVEKQPNGHFETRAEVNGKPVYFLIDTGATTTVLSYDDARAVGYDLSVLAFNIPVSTANGTARAARVTADEIRIGEIFRNRQTVFVAGPGQLGQSLLGMSFLSTLAGYDVRGDRMVLLDGGSPASGRARLGRFAQRGIGARDHFRRGAGTRSLGRKDLAETPRALLAVKQADHVPRHLRDLAAIGDMARRIIDHGLD